MGAGRLARVNYPKMAARPGMSKIENGFYGRRHRELAGEHPFSPLCHALASSHLAVIHLASRLAPRRASLPRPVPRHNFTCATRGDAPSSAMGKNHCARRLPFQAKAFPVFARRGSKRAQERAAQQLWTAEPAKSGDLLRNRGAIPQADDAQRCFTVSRAHFSRNRLLTRAEKRSDDQTRRGVSLRNSPRRSYLLTWNPIDSCIQVLGFERRSNRFL
jgi:hypothetical protein